MKRFLLLLIVLSIFIGASCSSNPRVTRVDARTQTDLSGYWNDTDVRIVSEALINDALNSPRVTQIINALGRTPVVLVGNFRNESSEHINTSIISSMMEAAIFNSGKMDFVAGGAVREAIREERQDQQAQASEETAAALANETGADFMLFGTVRTIVDRSGNQTIRTYFVSAEMTNIETNARMWMGQNDEIKKIITQPRHRL